MTLGAARRDGDELVVLDGTADVLAWAMSDDISGAPGKERVALSDVVLLAPTAPAQIVIVGLNYRSNVEEIGQPIPEEIIFFVSDRVEAAAGPDLSLVIHLARRLGRQHDRSLGSPSSSDERPATSTRRPPGTSSLESRRPTM
jgi:hypothetical protein